MEETRTLQQEFTDEVQQKQPGLVPGMPDYIKWLENNLQQERERAEQAEQKLKQFLADISDDMYCLETCSSIGHDEECPHANPDVAFRRIRERAEQAERERDELRKALKEVMNSYENYALMDKHEIEMDEYDLWMKEKWDEARRVVEEME